MNIVRLFEPEEAIGSLWHDITRRISPDDLDPDTAVCLADVRSNLALLFRALGGRHDVEITEATALRAAHKSSWRQRLLRGHEVDTRPSFDGERLRLPPVIADFATPELNKAAYSWLTAAAAVSRTMNDEVFPSPDAAPFVLERSYLSVNIRLSDRVIAVCPGLRQAFKQLCQAALLARTGSDNQSTAAERFIRALLSGQRLNLDCLPAIKAQKRVPRVPFWLDVHTPATGCTAAEFEPSPSPGSALAATAPKHGERRNLDETNRKDSFIVHRFETILSWAESMDINRMVEDNDEEHAKKAADDQDSVTLSKHDQKTASRLHLHLDLSPAEAEHERLAGAFLYPEWNHKRQAYMADHCRVLDAPPTVPQDAEFDIDRRNIERVRRQFEVLRTRRVMQNRQNEGPDLDLDALIAARADLAATGRGSDRIYIASRKSQRDLSVALLVDTSRSTEASIDGTSVIEVARHALTTLAHGLDACGDQFGIWSFSSLKRNRVFLTRCKDFDAPMSALIDRRIAALRPGHYTRLGAAIRHVSAQLAMQTSAQKLLLLLTDGKPNDVDHYEGKHGIEDSRMAVREARRAGQVVHGVVIDEDGQDWFARIFERGGFTLLPRPERLMRALPDIYRHLTQEF